MNKIPCIFPASREFWLSETGSLETASSSGESGANLIPRSGHLKVSSAKRHRL